MLWTLENVCFLGVMPLPAGENSEPRMPLAEGRLPIPIQHTGADLQQQVGAAWRPGNLLLFAEAFADDLVEGRLDKSGADALPYGE
jgi:hypothetical protein